MTTEILNFVPDSGDFPEFHFGEVFIRSMWVKFLSSNGEYWVGCFAKGEYNTEELIVDQTSKKAFINSGGIGYLIDIESRSNIEKIPKYDYIQSILKTENPDCFLISDFSEILIINSHNDFEVVRPDFIIDGFYLLEQIGNSVTGHLYSYAQAQEYNVGFELNLITLELTFDLSRKYKLTYTGEYRLVE